MVCTDCFVSAINSDRYSRVMALRPGMMEPLNRGEQIYILYFHLEAVIEMKYMFIVLSKISQSMHLQ
jgi:hypothetical protein